MTVIIIKRHKYMPLCLTVCEVATLKSENDYKKKEFNVSGLTRY